jgi:hypothetical protein
MPENAHTPGPWAIDGGYLVGLADPDRADTIAIFSDDCTLSPADKALIESAPALYAALQNLLCLYPCGLYAPIPEHYPTQTRQVIEEARAALAQAVKES